MIKQCETSVSSLSWVAILLRLLSEASFFFHSWSSIFSPAQFDSLFPQFGTYNMQLNHVHRTYLMLYIQSWLHTYISFGFAIDYVRDRRYPVNDDNSSTIYNLLLNELRPLCFSVPQDLVTAFRRSCIP